MSSILYSISVTSVPWVVISRMSRKTAELSCYAQWKPKYRASIVHHFVFVYFFYFYFFYHSSCRKDYFTVLILKFGTGDFIDPGLLNMRLTVTGLSLWFCLPKYSKHRRSWYGLPKYRYEKTIHVVLNQLCSSLWTSHS